MRNSFTPDPLPCPELPAVEASELDRVRAAFARVPACELRQLWRPAPEPDFQPGRVRVGWRADTLLILAELADRDIFTAATDHHQWMWELGDTFEIFLQPSGGENYAEFHVTPNNRRLAMRFPRPRDQFAEPPHEFIVREDVFSSAVWTQPEAHVWWVFAQIPAAAIPATTAPQPGNRWRFSFSRYDYTRGRKQPVLSSSSPHAVANFHRLHEWGTLRFEGAARPA